MSHHYIKSLSNNELPEEADHLIPEGGEGMVFLPNQTFLPSTRKHNIFFRFDRKQTFLFSWDMFNPMK